MDLEQQLREALAPCEPGPEPEAAVIARISSAARRKPSRVILFSTILAVAAAAAMVTTQLRDASAPPVADVAPSPVSAAAAIFGGNSVVVDTSPAMPAKAVVEPAEKKPAPKEAVALIKPFTVRVLPLQNQATDAAGIAVESFYARLLDELRAVPGLTLIPADAAGSGNDLSPNFEITIKGSGPVAGNKITLSVTLEREGPFKGSKDTAVNSATVDAAPFCAGSTAERLGQPCTDSASHAVSTVQQWRMIVFPPDPSLQQQLQARLLERALDPRERFKALVDLGTGRQLDPVTVRGAIRLAADATDPALRAQIWYVLRGVRYPELLPPLVSSLREDPDGEVRLQALTILADGYTDEARVRSAFEVAARADARPLVRALAQRSLTGDSTWKDYMVSTLKDTTRPIAERVEAFMYYMYKPGPTPMAFSPGNDHKLVDKELLEALGKALPQAIALQPVKTILGQLTYELDRLDKQLTTTMLLDALEQSTEPGARASLTSLLARRTDDARVRAALSMAQ